MPLYTFENPKNGITKDIYQKMEDPHVYSEDGVEWRRIFLKPNMSVDVQINPESAQDFVRKTGNSKGTIGDLFDQSKELSMKRESIYGQDPVKEQYFKDYSKQRRGRKHPDQKPKVIETKDVIVELD